MAALLALASCLLISRCWDAPFYVLDDRDQALPGLEQSFAELLSAPRPGSFPITAVSFRIDYLLFGTSKALPPRKALDLQDSAAWAAGSRVLNAFYHFLAALLLYWFLSRLKCGPYIPAFAALAWAVHPMACESVCWVAERKTILVAMFGFAALVAWTYEKIWRWPLIAVLFSLAVLCKGSALGLLPVFFCLEFTLSLSDSVGRWKEARFWLTRAAHLALPSLIFAFGMIFARRVYPWDMVVDPPGGTIWTALLSDVVIGAQYLFNTLLPVKISFLYAFEPVISLGDPRLWGCLLAIGAGCGALIWLAPAGRRSLSLFGLLWFAGAASPNCNLIAQAFPIQDRFIYLSIPGLLLTVALAAEGAFERWKIAAQSRIVPGAAFVLFLSVLAVMRSGFYVSDRLLVMDAAQRNPTSGYAQWLTGRAYMNMTIESLRAPTPDPQSVEFFGTLAEQHFDAAALCPDIGFYANAFELRLTKSQVQVMLGQYAGARETLAGWVPPPNMIQLPENPKEAKKVNYRRTASTPFYRWDTLRMAWTILAELALRESAGPNLSLEQRAAKCREGLDAIAKGLAMKADPPTQMLHAKLLLQLSNVELKQQQLETARAHYDEAAAVLKSIPTGTNEAATAALMVEKIPRP